MVKLLAQFLSFFTNTAGTTMCQLSICYYIIKRDLIPPNSTEFLRQTCSDIVHNCPIPLVPCIVVNRLVECGRRWGANSWGLCNRFEQGWRCRTDW